MDYIIIEIHVLFFFKLYRCKKLEKELVVSLGTLIGFVSALLLFFGAIVLETDNYLMFIICSRKIVFISEILEMKD